MKKLDLNKILDNFGRACWTGFIGIIGWFSYSSAKEFFLNSIKNGNLLKLVFKNN